MRTLKEHRIIFLAAALYVAIFSPMALIANSRVDYALLLCSAIWVVLALGLLALRSTAGVCYKAFGYAVTIIPALYVLSSLSVPDGQRDVMAEHLIVLGAAICSVVAFSAAIAVSILERLTAYIARRFSR